MILIDANNRIYGAKFLEWITVELAPQPAAGFGAVYSFGAGTTAQPVIGNNIRFRMGATTKALSITLQYAPTTVECRVKLSGGGSNFLDPDHYINVGGPRTVTWTFNVIP